MPSLLSICPCGIDHSVCILSNGQQGGCSALSQRSQILKVYEKMTTSYLIDYFSKRFPHEFMVPIVHFKTFNTA